MDRGEKLMPLWRVLQFAGALGIFFAVGILYPGTADHYLLKGIGILVVTVALFVASHLVKKRQDPDNDD